MQRQLNLSKKAKAIAELDKLFLASEKDTEIFFEALMTTKIPNKRMVAAASHYKEIIGAKYR